MQVSFDLFPGDEETKGLGVVDKQLLQDRTGRYFSNCRLTQIKKIIWVR